jgi:hypothetical protein
MVGIDGKEGVHIRQRARKKAVVKRRPRLIRERGR